MIKFTLFLSLSLVLGKTKSQSLPGDLTLSLPRASLAFKQQPASLIGRDNAKAAGRRTKRSPNGLYQREEGRDYGEEDEELSEDYYGDLVEGGGKMKKKEGDKEEEKVGRT